MLVTIDETNAEILGVLILQENLNGYASKYPNAHKEYLKIKQRFKDKSKELNSVNSQ